MPNEHNQNDDLITTDEAKLVIDLYAKKEQARRAEQMRIAAMPKLADIAEMAGLSLDEARLLALQFRLSTDSDYRIRLELDADGEEHLSQSDADELIWLAGRQEEAKQKDAEKKVAMPRLSEIADSLGIAKEDAAGMLSQVRRNNRFGKQLESISQAYTKPQPANLGLWRYGVIVVVLLGLVLGVLLMPSKSAVPQNVPAGTIPRPAFTGTPPAYGTFITVYAPWDTSGRTRSRVNPTCDMPQGYYLDINRCPGIYSLSPVSKYSSSGDPQTRFRQLLNEYMPMRYLMSGHRDMFYPVPGYNVPLSPPSKLALSSNIFGWAVYTVHANGEERSVYLPDTMGFDNYDTEEGRRYRRDYLAGLRPAPLTDYPLPSVDVIDLGANNPPPGWQFTVLGKGKVYQTRMTRTASEQAPNQLKLAALQRSAKAILEETLRRDLSLKSWQVPPAVTKSSSIGHTSYSLQVHYTYDTRPLHCDAILKAMAKGDPKQLDMAWQELNALLESALDGFLNQRP